MTTKLDLNRLAQTDEAIAYREAVRDDGRTVRIGAERFTASGDSKVPAPVRPTICADDFTATGMSKTG